MVRVADIKEGRIKSFCGKVYYPIETLILTIKMNMNMNIFS